jgi:hypothetical protein
VRAASVYSASTLKHLLADWYLQSPLNLLRAPSSFLVIYHRMPNSRSISHFAHQPQFIRTHFQRVRCSTRTIQITTQLMNPYAVFPRTRTCMCLYIHCAYRTYPPTRGADSSSTSLENQADSVRRDLFNLTRSLVHRAFSLISNSYSPFLAPQYSASAAWVSAASMNRTAH